jgi:dimethylglycine dehydrogenase
MLLGTYERAATPWSPRETPWDFGQDLLEPNLERIAPSLEIGFQHFPALQHTGIRKIVNGPFHLLAGRQPAGRARPGPQELLVRLRRDGGFSQGGGVGLALSNWMADGDPGFDVWGMDVAASGLGDPRLHQQQGAENYSRRFRIRFPNEELPAARPMQTTPLYDRMRAQGAVMGDSWGLETPLWFAPHGVEPQDIVSFHRSNDFEHVKREVKGVREGVGVTEIANFAKYAITGSGAESFLSRVMANKMPKAGRIVLTPMLNEEGRLIGDFTIAKAQPAKDGEDRFFMWGSSQAQIYHMRWFERHLPKDGPVSIRPLGMDLVGLSVAGPKARDVLARLTDEDVSGAAFRFLISARPISPECP